MSTILRTALLAASVAVAMFSAPSQAAQIVGAASGLSGSPNIQTFSTDPLNNGSAAGALFSPLVFTAATGTGGFVSVGPTASNFSGQAIANFGTGTETSLREFVEFSLGSTMTDVAFALAFDADPGDVFLFEIKALLGASTIDTIDLTSGAPASGTFYGFTGLSGFDKIRIDMLSFDTIPYYIDNLQTPAANRVPEPETLALLGLGLLGLAATRRRQRA